MALHAEGRTITSTKILWTYWHQGWDAAPSLVQRCLRSWVRLNPDYEVRALDRQTLFDHIEFPRGIDPDREDLTVQKIAALGRLALLARYGGAWADATVFCTTPLRDWLEPYFESRFFAFRSPGPDRLMSNWFIAADSSSLILQRLYDSFACFYAENRFTNQGTAKGDRFLASYLPRYSSDVASTLFWHSSYATQVLRVYPYFIFHYTFNRLILTDPECAALWNRAKPFPAEPAHRLQELATRSVDGIELARREIDSGLTPMYKLDWRADGSSSFWAAILQHLHPEP